VAEATTLVQYFVEFDVKNVIYCRVLDISQIILLFQETLFAVDRCGSAGRHQLIIDQCDSAALPSADY
jgi:hypothetical protein